MEKYLVTCWDPSEIYLSQPVNTLVKAGGVQAAIDLVKDASDDGDAYQWMATKMADLLEPKVVPAGVLVDEPDKQKEKVKRYLKGVYYEGTTEEAVDALVDVLYADDVVTAVSEMLEKFKKCLEEDEGQFGQDIYKTE